MDLGFGLGLGSEGLVHIPAITKSSPSSAWKTVVLETVKLFHKFEGGHPKRGR